MSETQTLPVTWWRAPSAQALLALAARIRRGQLTVTLPDGSSHAFAGPEPGAVADIAVHEPRMLRRVLFGGGVGFAESYMDGDWESDDLTALIALALDNWDDLGGTLEGTALFRWRDRLSILGRINTRSKARRHIAQHYDLGNAFYGAWLDPTMTYSSAVFDDKSQTLESAQRSKYRRMARLAGLRPEHHVLEIGCGWGGFALFAAREIGCRVTAVTLSEEQYRSALHRVRAAGMAERVRILLRDYRDLPGRYDRIVSIEMFEAVGERYWPRFFETLRARLAPGGWAALQVITIRHDLWPRYRRGADFIQRYIFPGGLLPSMPALEQRAAASGLAFRDVFSFGTDYAETLARWHRAFDAAWPQIAGLGFDERFRRMWKFYLSYCESGFIDGRIDVKQFRLTPL